MSAQRRMRNRPRPIAANSLVSLEVWKDKVTTTSGGGVQVWPLTAVTAKRVTIANKSTREDMDARAETDCDCCDKVVTFLGISVSELAHFLHSALHFPSLCFNFLLSFPSVAVLVPEYQWLCSARTVEQKTKKTIWEATWHEKHGVLTPSNGPATSRPRQTAAAWIHKPLLAFCQVVVLLVLVLVVVVVEQQVGCVILLVLVLLVVGNLRRRGAKIDIC